MDVKQFAENIPGKLVELSSIRGVTHSFIPDVLPPEWAQEKELYKLIIEANTELARLDGIGHHLPNPQLLITPLHHLEAQMSSALEGTVTHPQQQMLFDMELDEVVHDPEKRSDLQEVSNYKTALRIRTSEYGKLPISLRLVKGLHSILMEGVRGENKNPGEFRRLPVQIGRPARFVPPPANEVLRLMDNLEKFIHLDTPQYDPLVKAFIVHYQFEAIHPFSDGNGRVGRLLLSLMIEEYCHLSNQWLYLSPYFKKHRSDYLDNLLTVSTKNDWISWLEFCLLGVIEESKNTQSRCEKLLRLSRTFHELLGQCGKNNARLMDIVDSLLDFPTITLPYLQKKYDVSRVTAYKDVQCLIDLGIVTEASFRSGRAKVYLSTLIFNVIFEGTE